MLNKSIIIKNLLSEDMDISSESGLEVMVSKDNNVGYCSEVLGKTYSRPWGFLIGKMGVSQGLVPGTMKQE